MDSTISDWLTLPVGMFCICIYLLTIMFRRVMETAFPIVKLSIWWERVALPSLPVLLGGLIALLASDYPFAQKIAYWPYRLVFGFVLGAFSESVYTVAKGLLKSVAATKAGKSMRPPPMPPLDESESTDESDETEPS